MRVKIHEDIKITDLSSIFKLNDATITYVAHRMKINRTTLSKSLLNPKSMSVSRLEQIANILNYELDLVFRRDTPQWLKDIRP